MIKKIHITNFKGIKETVSLELKPITLLFGPNSAGKSSIIQAIHFLKEILERKNYDPRNTAYGGKALNLGGFKNLVHGHDEKLPIRIAVELDLNNIDLPGAQEIETQEQGEDFHSYSRFSQQSESCKLAVEIRWIEQLERVEATEFLLEVNNELFASITLDYTNPKNVVAYFDKVNIDHSIGIDRFESEEPRGLLFSSLTRQTEGKIKIEIDSQSSVLPNWEKGITIGESQFLPLDEVAEWYGEEESAYDLIDNYESMMKLVCQVMTGVGKQVISELEKFRYIGPIREIPPRNFDPHFHGEIERWSDGLAAWDLIYTKQISTDNINQWLKHLKIGYEIVVKDYLRLNFNDEQILILEDGVKSKIFDMLQQTFEESDFELPLMKEGSQMELYKRISDEVDYLFDMILDRSKTLSDVIILDKNSKTELKAHDIGVGISQVLPVIVGALNQEDSILAIEQPELHLHPAIQVEMADLFISQINKKPDVIYLLETHSEHLMLRFLRRIEETGKNSLKEEQFKMTPEKINVFVIPEDFPMKGFSLPIDQTGEFEKEWPNGFFEEREEELFPDD